MKNKFDQNSLEIIYNVLNKFDFDYFTTYDKTMVVVKLKNDTIAIQNGVDSFTITCSVTIATYNLQKINGDDLFQIINEIYKSSCNYCERYPIKNIICKSTKHTNKLVEILDSLDLHYYQWLQFEYMISIILYFNNTVIELVGDYRFEKPTYRFIVNNSAYEDVEKRRNEKEFETTCLTELFNHMCQLKEMTNSAIKSSRHNDLFFDNILTIYHTVMQYCNNFISVLFGFK